MPFDNPRETGRPLTTKDSGVTIGTNVACLNFDANLTATDAGDGCTEIDAPGGGGSGDVVGPASATDENIAVFDGTTGKLIKDGGSKISDILTASQQQIVTVAKSGAQYTDIQSAIDSITDATASKPYLITVAPGDYSENLTLKPYVNIEGSGTPRVTTISGTVSWTSTTTTDFELILIKNIALDGLITVNLDLGPFKSIWFYDVFLGAGADISWTGTDSTAHALQFLRSSSEATMTVTDGRFISQSSGLFDGFTLSGTSIGQHFSAQIIGTVTLNNTSVLSVRSAASADRVSTADFVLNNTAILSIDIETFSTANITNNTGTNASVEVLTGLSAGLISPFPTITDTGVGTVNLAAGSAYLFDNATNFGLPRRYNFSAVVGQALADNSNNYISIDYNSGSPQYRVDTTDPSNESNIIPHSVIFREGNDLHIYELDTLGEGLSNKINQRFRDISQFDHASGLALGEAATRLATITAGRVYAGAVPIDLTSFNSGVDTWDFYANVAGVMTKNPAGATTQYNNTQYDDGTNLQSLGVGRWTVNYIYRDVDINDNHAFYVLGSGNYVSLALARLDTPRSDLPDIIKNHSILVGRILVQNGATTGTVESAFVETFAPSQVTNHNDLANIQGGTASEYYHLTATEYTNLALTTNNLGDFAATTSAQLAGVISDETGSGSLVFATSPTLVTPNIGAATATSLDMTEGNISNVGDITHDDATASDWTLKNADLDKDILLNINKGSVDTTALQIFGATGNIQINGGSFYFDSVNDRFGIGTSTPAGQLSMLREGGNATYVSDVYSSSAGNRSAFTMRRYGNTEASPTAVGSGYDIFQINSLAYDGTAERLITSISSEVETYTGTDNVSGFLAFSTRPDGVAASSTERMRIAGDGQITMEQNLKIAERASAAADTAAYGQIWVKNDTPNTLWFTDDAGTDVQLGVGGLVWGASASGTSGTGLTLTAGANSASGTLPMKLVLDNTQTNTLNALEIETGTAVKAHKGALITVGNSGANAQGINIVATSAVDDAVQLLKIDTVSTVSTSNGRLFGIDINVANNTKSAAGINITNRNATVLTESQVILDSNGASGIYLDQIGGKYGIVVRGQSSSATNARHISVGMDSSHPSGGIGFYTLLDNTQSNALIANKIDLGTSAQGHTGLLIEMANASTSATGVKVDLSTTGTGRGVEVSSTGVGSNGLLGFFSKTGTGTLVAQTQSNVLIQTSRVNTATAGVLTDDYDHVAITRSNRQNGAGGILTASGSTLRVTNQAIQTAGTLNDSVVVLELVQDNDSTGGHILMNSYSGTPTTDGTFWFDGSDLKARIGGVTYTFTKT